jgi:transketolase
MQKLTEDKTVLLNDMAFKIRQMSLEMITYSQWGHIGGAFSMAELLAVLYWHEMKINPTEPLMENRDRLILSKAHGSPALYAALAARGYYPEDDIYTYCELGGLEGHTHIQSAPGIEASGGPLGMGLSVSVGMALGLRKKENPRSRVYCLMGDGEINEGNVWEAAMAASHYHLDNLIGIVDYNKAMAKGLIWEMMGLEPLVDKWQAFGWNVQEIDGHDVEEVAKALYKARWILANGKPNMIIAHTVKGKGIERAEFNYKWHTHAPDPKTADEMMREACRNYGRPEVGYSKVDVRLEKESFYGGE